MIRVKEKDQQGIWINYDLEEKTIKIKLAYLTDKELSSITEKSQKITWENHQKKEVLDDAKFKKNLVKSVLMEIEGAEVKDLEKLIEPNLEIEYEGNLEAPLKLENDVKTLIAENIHYRFARYIYEKSREINDYQKQKEKEAKENL